MAKKYSLHKCLQFGLAGLLSWLSISLFTAKTQAQPSNIIPDNTLGAESSQVISNFGGLPVEVITGGAVRQINLFHSFREFNVSAGRGAYFFTPNSDIQNIFTRVTGNNPSEILGRLGTFGRANPNLYLINPNGIIFGQNASLNLQGSFVGTTANGIQFGNQGNFSATNPQPVPLLTINPSALFFNRINQNAGISNQSQAAAGQNLLGENVTGLRVPDGKSLLLVGGNINIDGGSIRSYGGNIELASLSAPGNVGLNIAGNHISLAVPDGVERANVSLTNAAEVNVRGANGGDIKIYAHNVNLAGESKLRAGIDTGLGTPNSQGGNVDINATGRINLIDGSFISNVVRKDAFGKSGDINITTGSLNLSNDSFLDVSTFGQGNAGNIFIQAKDNISLTDSSEIDNNVEEGSKGNAGTINIQTGSLSLAGGSELNTKTLGQGNAGNININARDGISLDGFIDTTLSDGNPGRIYSRIISGVNPEVTGNAGNIQIKTGSLQATNGAFISSSTHGKGNGGNISIKVDETLYLNNKSYFISDTSELVGNGGDINIETGKLFLDNDAGFSATTNGKGNGGNITVTATDTISMANKSTILSLVSDTGLGNAGNINIIAKSFSASGESLISNSNLGSKGNAGNISINTQDNISLTGGSSLSNATSREGNVGNIQLQAGGAVTISGRSERLSSGISSSVLGTGVGDSGDIEIFARSFELSNGAGLFTLSFGKGNAGNILINTSGDTIIKDSNISTFIARDGNAGKIAINAGGDVSISGKSALSSILYFGVGRGGDIEIQGRNFSLSDGAALFSSTVGKGNAGNVLINATGDIAFTNGANINAATLGQGNAGNVTVNAGGRFSLEGSISNGLFDTGIFSIVGRDAGYTGKGEGGNINVTARDLFLNGAALSASSLGDGIAGNVNINSGTVTLDNQAIIAAATTSGNGGNINLTAADLLLLLGNSNISTTAGLAKSDGNGGNININAKFIVAVPNENSDISANAFLGNGGNIAIYSQGIFGIEARPKPTEKSDITASSELGLSGVININSPDTSSIQNSFAQIFPLIDTNKLIAQSCIARANKKQENSFFITGSGALNPNRPGEGFVSTYTTGEVRGVVIPPRSWKKGDPIIEATGVYFLDNGQILLSRECSS